MLCLGDYESHIIMILLGIGIGRIQWFEQLYKFSHFNINIYNILNDLETSAV